MQRLLYSLIFGLMAFLGAIPALAHEVPASHHHVETAFGSVVMFLAPFFIALLILGIGFLLYLRLKARS